MKRTVNCVGSVFLGLDIPDAPPSKAAQEGTKAHGIAETILSCKLYKQELPKFVGVPEEMITYGHGYADYVIENISPYLQYPHTFSVEKRLEHDDTFFGTADFIFSFSVDGKESIVFIFDYKYGVGTFVDVEDNYQLISYCLCAKSYTQLPIAAVKMFIYQPRVENGINSIVYKTQDLSDKFQEILSIIALSEEIIKNKEVKNEHLNVGDWCKWCKVKPVCKKYQKQNHTGDIIKMFADVFAAANEEVKDIENPTKKDKELKKILKDPKFLISKLTHEDIALIVEFKSEFTNFVDEINSIAFNMLNAGVALPNLKLTDKNNNRTWSKDIELVKKGLVELGIEEPVVVKESLVSITEVEGVLGKGVIDHLLSPTTTRKVITVGDATEEKDIKSMFDDLTF
jgi:hypothetical protein